MEPIFRYLVVSERDSSWGITVDTVGQSRIEPGYSVYPPNIGHPEDYHFDINRGRILDNYLLLYISQGRGWYHESPEKCVEVKAGSIILLTPYTWHSYYPDKRTGWQEYWIGFRGPHIDSRYENGFFNRDHVIHPIGFRESLIDQYNHAIDIALNERLGCQQVLASIANNILASVIYYDSNEHISSDDTAEKIDKARSFMRENMLANITPADIAGHINMSYSWFRKTFKEYTNVSPAHYITQLKLQKAKMMLLNSSISVKQIAFDLNYEDAAYFSAIFRKYVGCTPSEYKSACIDSSTNR